MKIRTAIIGLFIFAFAATAHAQDTPVKSRHQTIKKVRKAKKVDATVNKKVYHSMKKARKARKVRKAAVNKRIVLANKRGHKKRNVVSAKKRKKANRAILHRKHAKAKARKS